MKNTTLYVALFAFLSMFLLVASASAVSINTPSVFTINSTSTNVIFTNTNSTANETVSYLLSSSGIVSDGTNQATISPASGSITVQNSSSQTVPFAITSSTLSAFKFGIWPVTLTATGSFGNQSTQLSFVKSFCTSGSVGTNLSINNIDINGNEEDFEWKPLDTVKVEVDVENKGTENVRSVIVELALFDSSGTNKVKYLDFTNSGGKKVKLGTIDDDDEETAIFEFKVSPDLNSGSYKLAVKAYSDDAGEANLCADQNSDLSNTYYQIISTEKEDDDQKLIAFDNNVVSPTEATCGDAVTLSYAAYNVGSDDQSQVKIRLYNKDLKIDLSDEIKSGLDSGDKASNSFSFAVPQGLADKTQYLELFAEYDYDEDSASYGLASERTLLPLKVFGCASTATTSTKIASITASMESDKAVAGEQLKITSTISNLQTTNATFTINAKNFDSWADLDSTSESTFILAPGQSKDVTFTFNVKSDAAEGEHSFNVETTSNTKTESREVAVNIEKNSFLSSIMPSSMKENSLFWIIGAVNLVLIVLIIFVAVRLARH